MTMQIDNKSDSLSDNLWEEMTLMTAVVVILLARDLKPECASVQRSSPKNGGFLARAPQNAHGLKEYWTNETTK
jgi:hypothetical protein